MVKEKTYVIGVDLGGTNIAAGLLDEKCRVLSRDTRPTEASLGIAGVIGRIVESIRASAAASAVPLKQIRGVGIASPGVLDTGRGVVITAFNLSGWRNVSLREMLKKKLGRPVFMGHDAAMAALGEHRCGAGRGVDNLACITLGTGVGIGLIIDGKLYERSTGDLGHMIVDRNGPRCRCGCRGCVESYVGGPRIAAQARLKKKSVRAVFTDAKTVFEAAGKGNRTALKIVDEVGEIIGIGIVNTAALLNPERIVIGGLIAQAGKILFGRVKKRAAAQSFCRELEKRIVPAQLGGDAGIVGAGCLVREKLYG